MVEGRARREKGKGRSNRNESGSYKYKFIYIATDPFVQISDKGDYECRLNNVNE